MQNKRRTGRNFILAGITLAVIAFVFLSLYVSAVSEIPESPPVMAMIVAANTDISAGSYVIDLLNSQVLSLSIEPVELIPQGSLIISSINEDAEESDEEAEAAILNTVNTVFSGASIKNNLISGDTLKLSNLTWSAPIPVPDGMVGVGVGVNAVESIGGILKPGDRVDVIAAYEDTIIEEVTGNEKLKTKAVVLEQNVLVLDVFGVNDQRGGVQIYNLDSNYASEAGDYSDEGILRDTGFEPTILVVVLAVQLNDATKIHYMQSYGSSITLVSRSPMDPLITEPEVVDGESFRKLP